MIFGLTNNLLFIVNQGLTGIRALRSLRTALRLKRNPLRYANHLLKLNRRKRMRVQRTIVTHGLSTLKISRSRAGILKGDTRRRNHSSKISRSQLAQANNTNSGRIKRLNRINSGQHTLNVTASDGLRQATLRVKGRITRISILALTVKGLSAGGQNTKSQHRSTRQLNNGQGHSVILRTQSLTRTLTLAKLRLGNHSHKTNGPTSGTNTATGLGRNKLRQLNDLFRLLIEEHKKHQLQINIRSFRQQRLRTILLFALNVNDSTVHSPVTNYGEGDKDHEKKDVKGLKIL